jgi:hypothetical protein
MNDIFIILFQNTISFFMMSDSMIDSSCLIEANKLFVHLRMIKSGINLLYISQKDLLK